ncbi:MAG: 4-alpha-glucanotransferase [Nitrospirae bacterium]|nr:4-alpha-glucanotransferase [Nitrospirota bacterium]
MIDELAELCGIIPEYYDIFGNKQVTPVETKKAILKAMKLKVDSREDLREEIEKRRWKPWKGFIEPVKIISVNEQPLTIPVYIPVKEGEENRLMLSWSIEDEKGQRDEYMLSGKDIAVSEQQWIDGMRYIKIYISDKTQRDIGYYGITIECAPTDGQDLLRKTAKVIITPDTCYIPPRPVGEGRTWGLYVNLYSIRSSRNWGIGDFTDLKNVVKLTAALGGGFVGINPLHAIPNTKPYGISPYSPISRLYKNFVYLDVENIPDVKKSDNAMASIISEVFKKELGELRNGDLIDYEKVASVKEEILKNAFNAFYERHYKRKTKRGRDFKRYISEEGNILESFAMYMALSKEFGVSPSRSFFKSNIVSSLVTRHSSLFSWQEWPEEYRDLSGKAVQKFKKANKRELLFYEYIQWLIDGQLKEVAEDAKNSGMAIGLYHDLAIGSVSGGSDVWSYQDVVGGANVGAPPDDFNPNGQNWGFPPLIPEALKETGYELFIQTMRKNMKYGGALRIDHAPGLFRLFWIPYGMSPRDGGYVRYPYEDLLRIIALESVRNRTMVIAEDLGTIGENVRETLQRFQMLSYRLFYFERNYPEPSFVKPEMYPEMALCAVTTHDLPTLYGYWLGQDLKVKKELGMYPDENVWQHQINDRERDRALILSALRSEGILLPDDFPAGPNMAPQMTPELCCAIYNYLAKTPCKLVLVSLDDVIGTLNQQNMPGTVDTYPNWMQKTPLLLDEIVIDKRFVELSDMFRKI